MKATQQELIREGAVIHTFLNTRLRIGRVHLLYRPESDSWDCYVDDFYTLAVPQPQNMNELRTLVDRVSVKIEI